MKGITLILVAVFLFPSFVLGQEKQSGEPEWVRISKAWLSSLYFAHKGEEDSRAALEMTLQSGSWKASTYYVSKSNGNYNKGWELSYSGDGYIIYGGNTVNVVARGQANAPSNPDGMFNTRAQDDIGIFGDYAAGVQFKSGFQMSVSGGNGEGYQYQLAYAGDWGQIGIWDGAGEDRGLALSTNAGEVKTTTVLNQEKFSSSVLAEVGWLTIFSDARYNHKAGFFEEWEVGGFHTWNISPNSWLLVYLSQFTGEHARGATRGGIWLTVTM